MAVVMETLRRFAPSGPIILGGDLNTTTTRLDSPGAFVETTRAMLLNSRRFRYPERYEPLFKRLMENGFEYRGANALGRPSFTFTRLIPPWFRPRLDWIALRGLEPVAGSAAVVPARPSFFAPRVSDHDFIMVDVKV